MNKEPKILIVNTYDQGGAAKACIRLHTGLLKLDVKSNLLLKTKKNYAITNSFQFKKEKDSNRLKRTLKTLIGSSSSAETKNKKQLDDFNKSLPLGSETFSFPDSNIDITRN